jgi:hypothetical protein
MSTHNSSKPTHVLIYRTMLHVYSHQNGRWHAGQYVIIAGPCRTTSPRRWPVTRSLIELFADGQPAGKLPKPECWAGE